MSRCSMPRTVLLGFLLLAPVSLLAAEPERPIRFAWFPDFSPDGKWLVAPYGGWLRDEGGVVRVWNVKTGEAKFVIPSPRGFRGGVRSAVHTLRTV